MLHAFDHVFRHENRSFPACHDNGTDQEVAFDDSAHHALLLAIAGPVTALPLMLFAFGARRVSFVAIGLLQFLAPSIQFAIGLISGEPFTPLRALSFALIWMGLAIFSWDVWRRARWTRRRRWS